MAISVADLFKPYRFRPVHCDDLIAIYTGNPEDDFEAVDLTTERNAVTTNQNNTVDSFETANDGLISTAITNIDAILDASSLTGAELTAVKAAIAAEINTTIDPDYPTLKTDLATDLTSEIDATYDVSIVAVLTQVKTDIETEIIAEYNGGVNFVDARCGGTGREPNPITGTMQHCVSCDGLGVTATQNSPTVSTWGVVTELELD